MELLLGIAIGLCLVLGVALFVVSRSRAASAPSIVVASGGIESLRRVGELVVLRANWSIPAVGEDHIFGDVGQKFLRWLWSQNKTIMIFRFEIRFKYNLKDPASVDVASPSPERLDVRLGPPLHEINLADVRFYHTEQGRMLDWLLPRAINIFQSDMDDATRQKVLEAARENARQEAERLAAELRQDARQSAVSILTALGKSAGFTDVKIFEQIAEPAGVK
jgi:hypothetical protein